MSGLLAGKRALIVGIATFYLPVNTVAFIVLIGSGMILPAGMLIDTMRGLNQRKPDSKGNPLLAMFLKGTAVVVLLWPLVIACASLAAIFSGEVHEGITARNGSPSRRAK